MAPNPTDQPGTEPADRVTIGLIEEVFATLERHGYHRPDGPDDVRHIAVGKAVGLLGQLVKAYEGDAQ